MKLSIALLFFSLFLNSSAAVKKMAEAVYIPENTIRMEGVDQSGYKIILEYDRKNDVLTKTSGNKSVSEKSKDFDLFLKLFFFPVDQGNQNSFSNASNNLIELLKKNGIDTLKTTPSVSIENNTAAISIGKNKRFENSNELILLKNTFLPSALILNGKKYLFSNYHKSVFPASFPGRIEIYDGDDLIMTWNFFRKEYL